MFFLSSLDNPDVGDFEPQIDHVTYVFQARVILGQEVFDSLSIFGLETLPWATRIDEFGKRVSILATKFEVDVAVTPAEFGEPVMMDQDFIRICEYIDIF
jgi:hypothetical protein